MNYKWFVGIDVSKKTLDVTLYEKEKQSKALHKQFNNGAKGYSSIVAWLVKREVKPESVLFCLEHTGIYSLGFDLFC